ncbi:Sucrose-phosphatase 1 [Nymphaea thermarum]|nr:Sucrose-phosphatase 1 [Nymphaea thermarum]
MDRLCGPARVMIVSDLDHTMVDHHDPDDLSLLRFNALWEAHYRHDSLLVFSTGRSPTLYRKLREQKPMLSPDITIMSVGTEITYGEAMLPDDGWEHVLNQKWDREIVIEEASHLSHLKFQSPTEQRPHKVSFYVEKEHAQETIATLSKTLKARGLDVKIIYSGGIDLDILPQGAGKGQALAYLLEKFNSEGKLPTSTLVCGDSGNDADLFSVPDVYGVMVSNAQEELLQWHAENAKDNPKIIHATERCASGIIEAIGHFRLGAAISPRDITDYSQYKTEGFNPGLEVVKFYCLYERWCRADTENSEKHLQDIKHTFSANGATVHPWGSEQSFSDAVGALRNCYGDKQGKPFRVWIDRISGQQIHSDTWVVKFRKWEFFGEGRRGCITTAILQSKAGQSEQCVWLHLHQTWLNEMGIMEESGWIF